jgi:hypothetical protein
MPRGRAPRAGMRFVVVIGHVVAPERDLEPESRTPASSLGRLERMSERLGGSAASGYFSHAAITALRATGTSRPGSDGSDAAPTDEQLVNSCRAGSEKAFATVVTRYETALTCHCARVVGHSAAEDAVQEAFVAAWALNARARTPYAAELSDAIPGVRSGADEAADAARAREALAALAALPTNQRVGYEHGQA